MATNFPMAAKRGDPENGYMVVQQMVLFLRDVVDSFIGKLLRGNATVLSGNTTVVVPVSVSGTYSVVVTPLADPLARFWVSGKSSSQFIINLGAAAPVSGIAFDWVIRAA